MAVPKSGFFIVFNRIPEVIATVEAVSRGAPKRVADRIAADARSRAPVDTGYLKGSIASASVERGKTAEVFANAEYAGYVEYGTWKMAARPFLTPAFEAHKAELGLEIMAAVELKKIG